MHKNPLQICAICKIKKNIEKILKKVLTKSRLWCIIVYVKMIKALYVNNIILKIGDNQNGKNDKKTN